MKWILKADTPYNGSIEATLRDDGTVGYTNGQTLQEYAAKVGYKLRVVDDAELDAMTADYIEQQITEPTPIDDERWDYALGILPPSRWQKVQGVELFHICEGMSHDLVDWYAKVGERHFTFVDRDTKAADELARKVRAHIQNDAMCAR